jgi:2-polyprenyl-3-methyl-5-hydroxy-6-metoxy-1,4-benzoquinol methylase
MTDDGWFGEDVAAAYDQGAPMFDPVVLEPAVAFLAALAGDGPVLEFSIGTGRIALPLAARGPRVAGIELSCAMVARLAHQARRRRGVDPRGDQGHGVHACRQPGHLVESA